MTKLVPGGRTLISSGLALGVVLWAATAQPAAAQSLLTRDGLGYAADAWDARARGLGGVALGLPESNLSLVNPAGIGGLVAPALHVTFQPDYFSTTVADAEFSGSTMRFPLLHVALPLGERFAVSAGYGSLLEQSWATERTDSLVIGGDTTAVIDRFAARGGVAKLRLGGAYTSGRITLGTAIDVYTGSVRDTTIRVFGGAPLQRTLSARERGYSGVGLSVGVRWVPTEAVAVGASASVGGTLKVDDEEERDSNREFDLPVTLAAGASARVTANTLVAVAGNWTGWSSATAPLIGPGEARDSWSVSGGIEWEALGFGDRVIPLRLGGRIATLPFEWSVLELGDEWVDERVFTVGTGIQLAEGAARLDAALERGNRDGDGSTFSESFWRGALSVTVFGR